MIPKPLHALVVCFLLVLAETAPGRAEAAVIGYSAAINPGGHQGYVELIAVTQNTTSADWITVNSMGVKASFMTPGRYFSDPDWLDGVIPQGTITYVWSRVTSYRPQGGYYMVMGSHRYTEASVPHSLPSSLDSVFAPYY